MIVEKKPRFVRQLSGILKYISEDKKSAAIKFEKDLNEDKMKGKTIDSITFDFDVNDKKIEITNNNYTKEIYEALISKILEFSE